MKIGVVVPTYNQAQWLPGALLSIANHGVGQARIVVVDDGSTDTTRTLLAHLRRTLPGVTTVERDNAGTATAINDGCDRLPVLGVEPPAWSWCSSDNYMIPGWASPLLYAIDQGAGVAYGGFYWCGPARVTYHFTPYDPDRLINDVNCFFGPAFLIRADVWREAGPHRGKISHDYDHWLRVEEVCWRRGLPIVGVDEPLCYYMAHDERVTVTRAHEFDAHHWQEEARKRRGLA